MSRSLLFLAVLAAAPAAAQQTPAPAAAPNPRLDALKREAVADVESRAAFTQQMVDQIFSFGELGFQETETSKYLVDLLRREGFRVEGRKVVLGG